jgi:putative tricarboxylic transport membrane protein
LLLGFILGGMLEDNLRRSLTLSDGSWLFLIERPLTAALLAVTCLVLASPLIARAFKQKQLPDQG